MPSVVKAAETLPFLLCEDVVIKVLKTKEYFTTCYKCKTELQYEYRDIKEVKTNKDYLGGYDLVRGIQCPVCSAINGVSV